MGFNRWYGARPIWDRVLILIMFVWSGVIFFMHSTQGNHLLAVLTGPGWALFVYTIIRMVRGLFLPRPE